MRAGADAGVRHGGRLDVCQPHARGVLAAPHAAVDAARVRARHVPRAGVHRRSGVATGQEVGRAAPRAVWAVPVSVLRSGDAQRLLARADSLRGVAAAAGDALVESVLLDRELVA